MLKKTAFVLLITMVLLTGNIAAEDTAPAANNAFAFDLYQYLDADDNLIFSPFSITQAFGMAVAGAAGQTEQQIMDVMHYPTHDLHQSLFELKTLLVPNVEVPETGGKQPPDITIANAFFGQEDYPFRQDYIDMIFATYNSELRRMDFFDAPNASRQEINAWAAEQTHDRIQDVLPPGSVNSTTRLVLVNAIYFKASWMVEFDPDDTDDAPFYPLDGSTVEVPMMYQRLSLPYYAGAGFQATFMEYAFSPIAMMFVLPDDFETFEMNAAAFESAWHTTDYRPVLLHVPRFTFESALGLGTTLQAMGIVDAFDPVAADFSRMAHPTRDDNLYISDALHKAFIAVDEYGTEAAAVTSLPMAGGGAPSNPPVELRLDRPFLYFIFDQQTGTILFMGHVLNPEARQ